jgi:hypothetical protein
VDRARAHIKKRLRSGEQVLWWGSPDPGVWLTDEDKYLIPFGIIFTLLGGMLTLLPFIVHSSGQQIFAPWTALLFTFVGLYVAFIRLFVKRALKRRTVYALTTMAAITACGPRDIGISDRNRWDVTVLSSTDRSHLTVSFGPVITPMYAGSLRRPWAPNTGFDFLDFSDRFPVAFYDVADVDGLKAALILRTVARPPAPQSSAN